MEKTSAGFTGRNVILTRTSPSPIVGTGTSSAFVPSIPFSWTLRGENRDTFREILGTRLTSS